MEHQKKHILVNKVKIAKKKGEKRSPPHCSKAIVEPKSVPSRKKGPQIRYIGQLTFVWSETKAINVNRN